MMVPTKTGLLLFWMVFIPGMLLAQKSGEGTVRIIQDPAIEQLVQKHIRVNETREGIPGYRIQIFFDSGTNSKTKATSVCDEFRRRYPGMSIYLTFSTPNYKVRVGDFRTRLDAFRFLQELQLDYPNAYVVADQINLSNID
ncbi:MAG: SPOR domain-containing protein [Bacteroidetes bacterium]|nr:MAG: SPOR domain-containing protein [Bacteroidota bacterium]